MNSSRPFGSSASGNAWLGAQASRLAALWPAALQRARRVPLLLWALILAAGLLAFFVHLLNEQVLRNQMLREEQRAAAMRHTARPVDSLNAVSDSRERRNVLVASRQSASMP
jgi:hypothetical protein